LKTLAAEHGLPVYNQAQYDVADNAMRALQRDFIRLEPTGVDDFEADVVDDRSGESDEAEIACAPRSR
jgi:hypothetical protein